MSPSYALHVRHSDDTGSKLTTKELKEKQAVEQVENGKVSPENGNAAKVNGEQRQTRS